jgi:hypothetical protein
MELNPKLYTVTWISPLEIEAKAALIIEKSVSIINKTTHNKRSHCQKPNGERGAGIRAVYRDQYTSNAYAFLSILVIFLILSLLA